MKKKELTQGVVLINHLKKYGKITTYEAFKKYGITRLSAKIFDLRKDYNITSINTTKKNRYGQVCTFCTYILEGEK